MRQRTRALAVVLAVIVVVLIVAFVWTPLRSALVPGAGRATPPTITVTGVELIVHQGNSSDGVPWFGPGIVNYTQASGFPRTISSGGTFGIGWTFSTFDNVSHTIYRLTVVPPFSLAYTSPQLPYAAAVGITPGELAIYLQVPKASGNEVFGWVVVIVDALSP